MPVISALRQTEAWSGATILISVGFLILVIWLLFRLARQFIHGVRRP